MFKLLTKKRWEEIVNDTYEHVRKELGEPRCEKGVHNFISVFNKINNGYQPRYFGWDARKANSEEREAMFNHIYVHSVCKFCGKIAEDSVVEYKYSP